MPPTITTTGQRSGKDARIDIETTTFEEAVAVKALEQHVAVLSTFTVTPGSDDLWLRTWSAIAARAHRRSACRRFQLLRDRSDARICSVYSEWDSMADYNTFVHEEGILWRERALSGLCHVQGSSFLDIASPAPRHSAAASGGCP